MTVEGMYSDCDRVSVGFDSMYGWYGQCSKGVMTRLFEKDEDQMNRDLLDIAIQVVKQVEQTGKCPVGGWK